MRQIVLLYGEGRLLMKSKKRIALLLILTLLLSMVPWGQPARAVNISDFVDMPSDWSTDALEKAVNNGLISGFEEYGKWTIKPSANLTRAQMAAIVNRAFGATDKASISGVRDVSSGDWFAEDIASISSDTRVFQDGKKLYYDADGSGKYFNSVQFVELQSAMSLTKDQFEII